MPVRFGNSLIPTFPDRVRTNTNRPSRHLPLSSARLYYAYFDKPMFAEEIYAWRHCPAMMGLYKRFECFKDDFIEVNVKPTLASHEAGIAPQHSPAVRVAQELAAEGVVKADTLTTRGTVETGILKCLPVITISLTMT